MVDFWTGGVEENSDEGLRGRIIERHSISPGKGLLYLVGVDQEMDGLAGGPRCRRSSGMLVAALPQRSSPLPHRIVRVARFSASAGEPVEFVPGIADQRFDLVQLRVGWLASGLLRRRRKRGEQNKGPSKERVSHSHLQVFQNPDPIILKGS